MKDHEKAASLLTVELAGWVRNSCVVRLKTTTWADARGLHIRKDLMFLRRQCVGCNILEEDARVVGADEIVPRIVNLDESSDGIYEVVACNEIRDYETGYVEDYDYKLLPITTATDYMQPQVPVGQWPPVPITCGVEP